MARRSPPLNVFPRECEMTKLWKNGGFAADVFVAVDDATPLPVATPVIVTLKRWREARAEVLALAVPVGLAADVTAALDPASDELGRLALIVIPFQKFTDGRGYSLARRLRDEFGFRGEIRATGEVLIDQLPLMLRCGFDSFVISHGPTLRALAAGQTSQVPEVYQTAAYGRARTTLRFATRPKLAAAE